MSYLEQLFALRDALLQAAIAGPASSGYDSYGLDGESWSAANYVDRLEKLNTLILLEQNRSSVRRTVYVGRGRLGLGGLGVGGPYPWR